MYVRHFLCEARMSYADEPKYCDTTCIYMYMYMYLTLVSFAQETSDIHVQVHGVRLFTLYACTCTITLACALHHDVIWYNNYDRDSHGFSHYLAFPIYM